MAEIRTEIDLLDSWFRIADRDGDGRVHGGEAVDFFQRSGLGKEPLFQVQEAARSHRPRRLANAQCAFCSGDADAHSIHHRRTPQLHNC